MGRADGTAHDSAGVACATGAACTYSQTAPAGSQPTGHVACVPTPALAGSSPQQIFTKKLSLDEAHTRARTLPASILVILRRLRMLPRILLYAPTPLRGLLDLWSGKDSWSAAVEADRSWLLTRCVEPPEHFMGDFARFLRAVAAEPSEWLSLCAQGTKNATAYRIELCRTRIWRSVLANSCLDLQLPVLGKQAVPRARLLYL